MRDSVRSMLPGESNLRYEGFSVTSLVYMLLPSSRGSKSPKEIKKSVQAHQEPRAALRVPYPVHLDIAGAEARDGVSTSMHSLADSTQRRPVTGTAPT